MDPLNSPKAENNYQNIPDFPNVMDPNAPPPGAPPPVVTPSGRDLLQSAPIAPPDKSASVDAPTKPAKSSEQGDKDSDSDSQNKKKKGKSVKNVDRVKIKKLQGKMKRMKVLYWVTMVIWILLLVAFILVHLNTVGIHLLPFLAPPQ